MKKRSLFVRVLQAGLAAAVVRYLVSSGFGYYFRNLYSPVSGLWRAMMTPSWTQNVILAQIVLAFISVGMYAMVNTALGNKSETGKKGLKFGVLTWLLRDITGAGLTYILMPVSLVIMGSWVLSGFVISLINGQLIARIYK
jgi:hypothetical protein